MSGECIVKHRLVACTAQVRAWTNLQTDRLLASVSKNVRQAKVKGVSGLFSACRCSGLNGSLHQLNGARTVLIGRDDKLFRIGGMSMPDLLIACMGLTQQPRPLAVSDMHEHRW